MVYYDIPIKADQKAFFFFFQNKLAKLGDAIAISKSETITDSLTDWPTDWQG